MSKLLLKATQVTMPLTGEFQRRAQDYSGTHAEKMDLNVESAAPDK